MIIENLKILGMSEYEAKAYVSLVKLGKATAREVHEDSGIPRARIYDVLEKLVRKGFAEYEEGEPRKYIPFDPQKVIKRLKLRYITAAEESLIELEKIKLTKGREFSPALVMREEWNIKERIREGLKSAEKEVIILTSDIGFLTELEEDFKSAGRRVKLTIIVDEVSEDVLKFMDFAELRLLKKEGWLMREYFRGFVENGSMFKVHGFYIFDSKKSIVVIQENEKIIGAYISIPIIAYLQRGMMESLVVERTEKIERR
jgi:sugar-specific transcriptional regulator TrmB